MYLFSLIDNKGKSQARKSLSEDTHLVRYEFMPLLQNPPAQQQFCIFLYFVSLKTLRIPFLNIGNFASAIM
jgi:hypothetical protein